MTAEEYVKHYASGQGGFESVSVDVALKAIEYAKDKRVRDDETIKKIKEIKERGKRIIIVGGTGLYLKACLYDYEFKESSSNDDLLKKYNITI